MEELHNVLKLFLKTGLVALLVFSEFGVMDLTESFQNFDQTLKLQSTT